MNIFNLAYFILDNPISGTCILLVFAYIACGNKQEHILLRKTGRFIDFVTLFDKYLSNPPAPFAKGGKVDSFPLSY